MGPAALLAPFARFVGTARPSAYILGMQFRTRIAAITTHRQWLARSNKAAGSRVDRRHGVAAALVVGLLTGCASSDGAGDASAKPTVTDGSATTGTSAGPAAPVDEPLERYRDHVSTLYGGPDNWICRPDTDDPCDTNMDATVLNADGTTEVEKFVVDPDAPIDCFYVYPTISQDPGANSDLNASPNQEVLTVRNQVARLGSQCRVFAPVYRQVTLTALVGRIQGDAAAADAMTAARETAYADVLDAFSTYMANDNDGRGFILIGHSQGAGILNRLIAEQIDPNEDVRELFVSAFLGGSSVSVPALDAVVGGDFTNIPLCESEEQVGCVYTWASFRSTAPPPANTLFGRPRDGEGFAGCVSPASPSGGTSALHAYFPARRNVSILAGDDIGTDVPDGSDPNALWIDPKVAKIDTAFVVVPGLVDGKCVAKDGVNWLEVTVNADPATPRADDISGDLTPEWGLHLVDMNLVMGDMVDLVAAQTDAFAG